MKDGNRLLHELRELLDDELADRTSRNGNGGRAKAYAVGARQRSDPFFLAGKSVVQALQRLKTQVFWDGRYVAGPTFVRYPITPGPAVPVRAIIGKAEDIQVRLRLEQPPLIHNVAGELVIDVQRRDRQFIPFSSVAGKIATPTATGCSKVPIGVDVEGHLVFADLTETPHMLVAGTPGSGKSEVLRACVAGLITSNTPNTLRLMLIDPKRTAFPELKRSQYLYGPNGLIFPPEDSAPTVLNSLVEEMEHRYKRFSKRGAKDLADYCIKAGQILPRIICVCDEYADLIGERSVTRQVESAIERLGAMSRAAGIHLIIATQHPDRKIVSSVLKANLSAKVCLRTTNRAQSLVIIDQPGAERLLGKGDLLFAGAGEPVRLQAPYLPAEEGLRIFRK